MADTQKPAEVPQETPVAEPVVETTAPAATETPAVAPAVEASTPVAETDAAAVVQENAAAAPVEEAKKEEEVKPVEEGHLEHKGQGANFPKNFLYTKQLFWFGSDPVDLKSITSFKADKVADVAHHVTSWAAETGKGLLFFSEKGDKAAPNGAIHLADASEPAVDGANKFHITAKGHKHTFKAASAAERDNWVAQLKAKVAEAKELAATVTESETYKKTIEALKPAPVKKEEKVAAPVVETAATEPAAAATEETPAVTETAAVVEPTKEEPKEEEKADKAVEDPKRRSASRKRASIFGNFLGKREEKKAVEATEPKTTEAETPAAETSAAAPVVDAPATEVAAVEPTTEAVPATTEAAVEAKPEEKAEEAKEDEKKETPEARPAHVKRTSIFGNLSFGKKKAAAPAEVSPAKETPATTEAVAETAPVIPAVETSEPLSAEVSSPANVPTETVEAAPATNGETKKEMKSEKRKSSLPFAFGKKKDASSSDEEAEKPKSPSAFSKLRATIKGKGKAEKTEKAEEKTEETPAVPALPEAEAKAAEPATEEAAKPVEVDATAAKPATTEEEVPAKPLEATPAVTAAA
jgi:hypothetical protein